MYREFRPPPHLRSSIACLWTRSGDGGGFSERQLRRRFAVAVGYGPKTLQRVLRLRRFRSADPANLAQAALEAGYSDQAHLTRDCRELTGLTPLQLLRQ